MLPQFVAYHQGGISSVVRARDSRESTVATCNILHLSCRFNPGGCFKTSGRKEKVECTSR